MKNAILLIALGLLLSGNAYVKTIVLEKNANVIIYKGSKYSFISSKKNMQKNIVLAKINTMCNFGTI